MKMKDGLSAELLGFTGLMKSFYYMITNEKSARGNFFAHQGIRRAKKQLEGCAGFFLITGNGDKTGLIETGRRLESLWLNASRLSIAIHPFSAAMEEEPYQSDINSQFGEGSGVQMILRAGIIGGYGENAGIRRNTKDFVRMM
jgi:hypothetical protein